MEAAHTAASATAWRQWCASEPRARPGMKHTAAAGAPPAPAFGKRFRYHPSRLCGHQNHAGAQRSAAQRRSRVPTPAPRRPGTTTRPPSTVRARGGREDRSPRRERPSPPPRRCPRTLPPPRRARGRWEGRSATAGSPSAGRAAPGSRRGPKRTVNGCISNHTVELKESLFLGITARCSRRRQAEASSHMPPG